jgi:hypothetical protein
MAQSNAARQSGRAVAAVALVSVFCSCAFTQRRISNVSLRFMSKDPDLLVFREKEARALVKYGVFVKDMTPDEMKLVLGAPTFVWRAPEGETADAGGSDLKYGYQLDRETSLRADFTSGRLRRLWWQVERPNVPGADFTDIELLVRAR